jgi:hypothetical protein
MRLKRSFPAPVGPEVLRIVLRVTAIAKAGEEVAGMTESQTAEH